MDIETRVALLEKAVRLGAQSAKLSADSAALSAKSNQLTIDLLAGLLQAHTVTTSATVLLLHDAGVIQVENFIACLTMAIDGAITEKGKDVLTSLRDNFEAAMAAPQKTRFQVIQGGLGRPPAEGS